MVETSQNKKQTAELRIVVRAKNDYAIAFYAQLEKYDLYYGPRLSVGKALFKFSYHKSGKIHLLTPTGRSISEPSVPPEEIKGKKRLVGCSTEQKMLQWGYKPKPDSATRRTKILDVDNFNVPSWETELWALEPGRPELVKEVLKFCGDGGVVIDYLLAEWPSPNLLVLIWTMKPEGWAALERSIKNRI